MLWALEQQGYADTAQAPHQAYSSALHPGQQHQGRDKTRFPSQHLCIKAMRTARKGSVEMPAFVRQLVKETEKRVSSFFKGGRGGTAEGEQQGEGEKEEVIPSPYLDRPVLDKLTEEGCARWGLTYALGSMQGWRANMEDFHNCVPQLGGELADWSFFAVFDGHAGSTVAQYCSQHLLGHILATGERSFQWHLTVCVGVWVLSYKDIILWDIQNFKQTGDFPLLLVIIWWLLWLLGLENTVCAHRWNRTRRWPAKSERGHWRGLPPDRQAPALCGPSRGLGEGRHHCGGHSHFAILHLLCQLRWLKGHAVPVWAGLLLHWGPQTLQPSGERTYWERGWLRVLPTDQRLLGSVTRSGRLRLQGGREPDPEPADGFTWARSVCGGALAGRWIPGARLWWRVGHHQQRGAVRLHPQPAVCLHRPEGRLHSGHWPLPL